MIEAEKATYPIKRMRELLEVSRSGYYKWRRAREAGPSPTAARRGALDAKVPRSNKASDGVYGAPRILADLHAHGEVSGCHVRRWRPRCAARASDDELTTKCHLHKVASDLLVARKIELAWFAGLPRKVRGFPTCNARIPRRARAFFERGDDRSATAIVPRRGLGKLRVVSRTDRA